MTEPVAEVFHHASAAIGCSFYIVCLFAGVTMYRSSFCGKPGPAGDKTKAQLDQICNALNAEKASLHIEASSHAPLLAEIRAFCKIPRQELTAKCKASIGLTAPATAPDAGTGHGLRPRDARAADVEAAVEPAQAPAPSEIEQVQLVPAQVLAEQAPAPSEIEQLQLVPAQDPCPWLCKKLYTKCKTIQKNK